jgi:uncharacterized membrane protein
VLAVTPEETSILIGVVFFAGAVFFLKNFKKWWPKKDVFWYVVGGLAAAAYVIWGIAQALVFFYKEALTPVGHFLSKPSTWWWFLLILFAIAVLIYSAREVWKWKKENFPGK